MIEEPDEGVLASYRGSADLVASTNRMLLRVGVVAMAALLVVAVTVIVWGALRFGSEVNLVKTRQLQFHQDTISSNTALSKATAANLCLTEELNTILVGAAAAQNAIAHHKMPTPVVYPSKPC